MPKKIRRRLSGPWIVLLLLVFLAAGTFLGYKIFSIKDITVFGNGSYAQEDIIALSGIEPGINIFMLDEGILRDNIQSDPHIEYVRLVRKYPSTVEIYIKERQPAAMVYYLQKYMVIDENCFIIEVNDKTRADAFPIINGVRVTSFQLGETLTSSDEFQVKAIKELLSGLANVSLEVSEVNLGDYAQIVMLTKSGMTVRLGFAEKLDEKLKRAERILGELAKDGKTTGTLDVSIDGKGIYSP